MEANPRGTEAEPNGEMPSALASPRASSAKLRVIPDSELGNNADTRLSVLDLERKRLQALGE